ncbi:hypothetical protein TEA_000004 [Camellia sinensis var. sinensis]|uniref:Uncharacterized protein n=1 Tax=Camellia sinensis var. sinensis TaxID=542762 RepID=A0A4S4E5Y7_CAMSN|nr:hypothetical protein TEA_000004 [Camellia sinensis var. sinensis]
MEPQKKGAMYLYKLAQNPEANSPPATMKKAASRNHWGLRRSKTYRENEGGGRRRLVVEEEGGGEVVVEARKSVFSIEGRKSVSHVENNVEAAAAAAAFLQVKVLVTDMPGLMQVQAFRCARRTYDRAGYGVLRFIMESGAKGCEVIVSGKLKTMNILMAGSGVAAATARRDGLEEISTPQNSRNQTHLNRTHLQQQGIKPRLAAAVSPHRLYSFSFVSLLSSVLVESG